MGQAKNRGSFEKRKAEAIIRERPSLGSGIGMAITAVDPNVFLHLFKAGTEAGLSAAQGNALSGDAITQALNTAIKELCAMPVEGKDAYLARLSCLRSIYDSGRLDKHFSRTEDGHVLVEHALLRAMAVTSCKTQWSEQQNSVIGLFDLENLEQAILASPL